MSENPVEEAGRQAMQSAAMSVRLLVSIAMAVSERSARENPDRAAQVQRLRQLDLPPEKATERYVSMVREEFNNPALRDALLGSEKWPQITEDLRALESAGIDVRPFLRDANSIAERVAKNLAPQSGPEQLVREHLGDRLADTLTTSERWPQIADEMRQMQSAGVDMPQMLAAAAEPGAKIEASMAAAWKTEADRATRLEKETATVRRTAPPRGEPQQRSDLGGRAKDRGLTDRKAALKDVNLSPQENQKYVRLAGDAIEDRHHASVLVASRHWPQVAASMRDLEQRNIDPAPRLARLPEMLTQQVATGRRPNVANAAEDALRQPPPVNRSAARPAEPSYAAKQVSTATQENTESVTVSPDAVRAAAHHVVAAKGPTSPQTLREGLGVDERQARALVTELNKRDIIGYDPVSDRYETKAESKSAADLLVDGKEITATQANKSASAQVATATSSTSRAPKARTSEPAAAARTTHAHTQTKGRAR